MDVETENHLHGIPNRFGGGRISRIQVPDGGLVFNSTAPLQGVPCSAGDQVANLYRCEADGSSKRRLCFDQDLNYTPTVMDDGRIMYTRWEYEDVAHCHARVLMTMRPDGSQQMGFYGSNSYWPTAVWYAKNIPGRNDQFVAVVSGHHGGRRRGELILFDINRGQARADGAIYRFGSTDQTMTPIYAEGLNSGLFPCYLHPVPLSETTVITACRMSERSSWEIHLLDTFGNRLVVLDDPEYSLTEPIPVRTRTTPPVIPSMVKPEESEGSIYLSDIYRGPGLAGVPRSTVKHLRIYGFVYAYRYMAGWYDSGAKNAMDRRRMLGVVPVEADGSANFRVPANMPVSVQPIDAQGRALQTMRSWYTAMPGEHGSCVGCHERSIDAAPIQNSIAAKRPPSVITPWMGPARPYDFAREMGPLLARRCSGCHTGKTAKGPVLNAESLTGYIRNIGQESDYHLQKPGTWYASSSELVQMLAKGHHGVELNDEEFRRIFTWIDLNAPTSGLWAAPKCDQYARRRELAKTYEVFSRDLDSYPEPAPALPPFITPDPKLDAATPPAVCPGWPFDAASAKTRQAAEKPSSQLSLELGAGTDGKALSINLVRIPGGTFILGDPAGLRDEKPAAPVTIPSAFWMGQVEISNAIYALFDPSHDSYRYDGHPSSGSKGIESVGPALNLPEQPVVRVSQIQALAFCHWLSTKTGKRFTLPTEAQWEWACRAGSNTPFWYGDTNTDFGAFANLADQAFFSDRRQLNDKAVQELAKGQPTWIVGMSGPNRVKDARFFDRASLAAPCGSYTANPWGLQDMHGNASEWTMSAYKPYPYADDDRNSSDDPTTERVIRGGSWFDRPQRATASFRNHLPAWMGAYDVGFRVVCLDP